MKLRYKVLIAIGLLWLLFLGITYLGSTRLLLHSFERLEVNQARHNLDRAEQALDHSAYSLETFTEDWASWDDLYDFMLGNNPSFLAHNIVMPALNNSSVNLFTYWDKNGKLIVGGMVDANKWVPYPPGLERYIFPGSQLLTQTTVKNPIRGFVNLDSTIMMVASAAITNGKKTAPILGTLITGRIISPAIVDQISKLTHIDIRLYTLADLRKQPNLRPFFDAAQKNMELRYIYPVNNEILKSYSLIRDVNGKNIGLIEITSKRNIYHSGIRTIQYFILAFFTLGLLFSLLMWLLIQILFVRRLEKLDHQVSTISMKGDVSERLHLDGNDEIGVVVKVINAMLEVIHANHEKLEHKVIKRTNQLQKANTQLEQQITERKAVEKELIYHKEHLTRLAHYDALTNLPNRVLFNELLNDAIKEADAKTEMAILFMDLDRLKTINDGMGHPMGDNVLRVIAERFESIITPQNILARLGGDEFIILLKNDNTPSWPTAIAEKLLAVCKQPIKINLYEFVLTTSIGIALFPKDGNSLEDLQRNADSAMYKAKRSGGGTYEFFTEDLDTQAYEKIQIETALRKALSNDEFVLYFQPKFCLQSDSITSMEALIRWEDPKLGWVDPSKFIPLAEESDLIVDIGYWALRQACKINKTWQIEGYQPLVMAVNLSPKQFRHAHLVENILSILQETRLEARYLELEITETAVLFDAETAIEKMSQLKQMGVKISVDDFGSGYTSINYLKRFPVDYLKIDQSFIKGIPYNKNDLAIINAVIVMAHNLNMKVVAEGVETAEQLDYLSSHHCDFIQGYFISPPLPAQKVVLQLKKHEE